MFKLSAYFERITPLVKNGFISAVLFAVSLLVFYLYGNFSPATNLTFHGLVYALSLAGFMILLYFNQSKPVFYIICSVLCYILINFLKNKLGSSYISAAGYQNLCFFAPLNFAVFFFWPNRRLLNRTNVFLLLALFIQYAAAEQFSQQGIILNLYYMDNGGGLSGIAFWLFIGLMAAAFIRSSLSGTIMDYALFFSTLEIFFGFYYSASASALTIFFSTNVLCLVIALSRSIYNEIYEDSLTGLASRNSYIIHSTRFPLKYSIGIISIDDYEKLASGFGRRAQNILTKLISRQLSELEKEDNIYRYNPDEFVIIYHNMDKKESFERLENIRRSIATASFEYSPRRKALKLTVSAAVSEKKRSDANSFEVLVRARKVLQQTRSFSHNVTSQA